MRSLTLKLALCSITLAAFLFLSGCTKNAENPAIGLPSVLNDGVITGKITLAPLLERTTIQPSAAIYLIARPAGQTAGPPVAVKQFLQPFHFPIEFTLSKSDAMMPNSPFQGSFDITVRLAQSGSATPASPGDFEGFVESGSVKSDKRMSKSGFQKSVNEQYRASKRDLGEPESQYRCDPVHVSPE